MGHLQAEATPWNLLLSSAASVVALAKLGLLLSAEYSVRWRAVSVCLLQALLVVALLAATICNCRSKAWFAEKHEITTVLVEISTAVVTFWWLIVLKQEELLPQQTPLYCLICRGYLLVLHQVRLAACIPVLLLEAFALLWLELSMCRDKGSITSILQYLVLGQLIPLTALLHFEIQHRWQFIQHHQLAASTVGHWAVVIECYMLAAYAVQQQARKLQHWASSWPVLLSATVFVTVVSVVVASVAR